jgi:Uma2 family endonuclease
MTSDAFLAWAADQPDGARCELAGGRVVKMAAERAVHARTKFRIARQLFDAVQAAKLPCEVFADGMAVAIYGLRPCGASRS